MLQPKKPKKTRLRMQKREGELGGETTPQTQLAVARVDRGPLGGEDGPAAGHSGTRRCVL